jgi:hypothetical protein
MRLDSYVDSCHLRLKNSCIEIGSVINSLYSLSSFIIIFSSIMELYNITKISKFMQWLCVVSFEIGLNVHRLVKIESKSALKLS